MKPRVLVLSVFAVWAGCAQSKSAPPAHEHSPSAADASSGGRTDEHAAAHGEAAKTDGGPMLHGYAPVVVDQARQQLLGIKTARVERKRIDEPIRTVGIVQADETRTAHVHVKFDGFIEKIYVDYTGRLVQKGQPLFKVFSRDLLAAQQEYLSSRAAVARIPASASDAVRGAAQQLATASRERLRLFDVPPGVLAEIERTGVAQRAITIVSPETGNVIEKTAIEGLAVTPMMHLYIIANLSSVWVVADVYERDMSRVKVGQKARMTIDAIPGRTFEGGVSFVSPTLDPSTRTVKVRFEFSNKEGLLRPGAYATVDLTAEAGEGLVIGSDSVIDTGERKIVFVARGDGRFEPRAIVTGPAFDDRYQVLNGLAEDELVATSGQFLLDSESRIRGARTSGGPQHGGH
jgi:Cu(I)/Ag(I) efflux system membrane fusion protein